MACFWCGSQMDDLASFCTACGKPRGLVSVKPPSQVVCSSCGSSADPSSSFCTICGKPLQPVQTETAGVSTIQRIVELFPPGPHCVFCRSSLDPGVAFCTFCGQPVTSSSSTPAAASPAEPASAPAVPVGPSASPTLASSISAAPASGPPVQEPAPTPQPEARAYSPASSYPPASEPAQQPSGSVFRNVVLLLLLVIVVCGFGGWYFWGVETVIVCSPPDVRVFLDDKELQPSSYGRYVVPHLSRQSHLLKVQRPGFADTIQKLDFSLTSTQEWVNIKLVPRRQLE